MDIILIPDYEDDPSDILVSFPDIKAKTTQTLYQGGAIDKSPKGSVDEPIRPLVDLINRHPSFSTLSSCSGRISLFAPWGRKTKNSTDTEEENENEAVATEMTDTATNNNAENPVSHKVTGTPESGKGRGGWLLVSHERIQHSQLFTIFQDFSETDNGNNDEEEKVLMFKVEPMLLHIAAATHERGRQLLALALELGFRESGLVIPSRRSNHRVTVAIRGMSLALVVPLAFQGALKPSEAYLRALVDQSNQRMERNQAKLQRLFESVQKNLFQQSPKTTGSPGSCYTWECSSIPDLNLWGHDAVALPASAGWNPHPQSTDVDVLVFGGYGQGPLRKDESDSFKAHCRRNGDIYVLQRREDQWDTDWAIIQQQPTATQSREDTLHIDSLGISAKVVNYTAREGSAVFSFGDNDASRAVSPIAMVGIWGGRKGPHMALDELLLYDHCHNRFVTPIDIRGERPEARWGHSLTCLNQPSNNDSTSVRRLALLLGGRNERAALNTAYVLSLVSADGTGNSGHFLWEKVLFPADVQIPPLPFHHATVVVPDEEAISVFVFGGISNPCDLLESFGSETDHQTKDAEKGVASFCFSLPVSSRDTCMAQPCTLVVAPDAEKDLGVGGAATVLKSLGDAETPTSEPKKHQLLLSGGAISEVRTRHSNTSTLRMVELVKSCQNEWLLQSSSMIATPGLDKLEDSIMVHHRVLELPTPALNFPELLVFGGGVMGFAFGPCFSRSFLLQVQATCNASLATGPRSNSTRPVPKLESRKQAPAASADAKSMMTSVVYVEKHNAKVVKTHLEDMSLLDKRFRMTPAANGDIAVPITDSCLGFLTDGMTIKSSEYAAWAAFLQGTGTQEMPFSTSQFARKKKR